MIITSKGDVLVTDPSAPIAVRENSFVSVENSTTIPLPADGTFTGEWVDVLNVAIILVAVSTDVASAIDGLMLQWSSDGITQRGDDVYTIGAGENKQFSFQPARRYLRVVYDNGITLQGYFDLEVQLKSVNTKASSVRITDPIIGEDDAELVKAVLTGINDKGIFDNASLTNKGQFKVSIEEYGDTPSVDAFARLRVSDNFTIFDSKQLHDKQPLFWDEKLGGTATSTHVPADADVELELAATSTDYAIRQTKQRFNYQPGKSQLIFMTFRAPDATGIKSRIGYFDDDGTGNNLTPNNGIFFQSDAGVLSWNIAKNGTTTESVTQSNWNVDPLDGTGFSEIALDMDAPQILIMDYEWLGVGRVRCGVIVDGLIYYCHYFNHANDPTFPAVYMSTPNLPLRYDIQADGANAAGQLDHICSTVISEGGIEKTGILRAVDTGNGFITGLGTVKYAMIGIRLRSAYKDITVIPEGLSVLIGTNDSFKWELHINPVIAGTFTYNGLTDSSIEYAVGAITNTVTTGGTIIASGGASTTTRQVSESLNTALRIGSSIAGVQDTLVLVILPFTTNLSVWCGLNFRELL